MSEEERDKLIEEQIGTIERLERQLEWYDRTLEEKQKEITKRDKIIKEVREYIKEHSQMTNLQINGIENVLSFRGSVKELLEILDKEVN